MIKNNFVIRIADIYLNLTIFSEIDYYSSTFRQRYKGFISEKQTNNTIQIKIKIVPELLLNHLINQKKSEKDIIFFRYKNLIAGTVNKKTLKAEFICKETSFFDSSLAPTIEIVMAIILFQQDGLIFHAASIKYKGKGYIFFGNSGAGKSTIAQLAKKAGCTILSEDWAIIRKLNNKFLVFSTPFDRRLIQKRYDHAQIESCFLLRKSQRVGKEPIKKHNLQLCMNSCRPGLQSFIKEHAIMDKIFRSCVQFSENNKFNYLYFQKNNNFLKLLS